MKDKTIDAELTAGLATFLERRGYTHIISIGVEPKEISGTTEPEPDRESYWLEPIKADDERLKGGELDEIINEIKSDEVMEMLRGVDAIQFMVRVPLVDFNDYLAKR